MLGKKKKKNWFQTLNIKILGKEKKEVEKAMDYIQKCMGEYEGDCEFLMYYQF